MKKAFKVTDKALITAMLNEASYGVLALCGERPYAVPVNFVYLNDAIYFHSSPKGKKMRMVREHPAVSFSVVVDEVIIPSFFSSKEGLACPATSFFKSVIIDGIAEMVDTRAEVVEVFAAMMAKLQPEGGFKYFSDKDYDKKFATLNMVKIHTRAISAKFKFGQHLTQERFDMIIKHLEQRGRNIDLLTVVTMRNLYDGAASKPARA